MKLDEKHVTAGNLDVAYLTTGPTDGPLALCLHGFPDSPWTWRHLAGPLAEAGFHVVAPFLRGYAPTAVAADGCYQTGALVADAVAVHDALGGDGQAVLIGHDWGAVAAYPTAAFAPERWSRIVTAAVPPPGALAGGFLSYDQLRRSWYMYFFQHPLALMAVGMGDLAFIDRLWEDWSPGYDATEDLALLKPSLRDPANLAAAIGYYRATLGGLAPDPAYANEQAAMQTPNLQPTLYLHGDQDGCMGVELTGTALGFLGEGSRVEIIAGAGHFLHLEKPDVVNPLIVDFLTST